MCYCNCKHELWSGECRYAHPPCEWDDDQETRKEYLERQAEAYAEAIEEKLMSRSWAEKELAKTTRKMGL